MNGKTVEAALPYAVGANFLVTLGAAGWVYQELEKCKKEISELKRALDDSKKKIDNVKNQHAANTILINDIREKTEDNEALEEEVNLIKRSLESNGIELSERSGRKKSRADKESDSSASPVRKPKKKDRRASKASREEPGKKLRNQPAASDSDADSESGKDEAYDFNGILGVKKKR